MSAKSKKTCLQAYIFDSGVTLPTEESQSHTEEYLGGRPVARNFFQGGAVGAHIFIIYMTSNTNLPDFFDAPFQTKFMYEDVFVLYS